MAHYQKTGIQGSENKIFNPQTGKFRKFHRSPLKARNERGLLPLQEQFVALISNGATVKEAQGLMGLQRMAVRNWFRSGQFKTAFKEAQFDAVKLLSASRRVMMAKTLADLNRQLDQVKDERLRLEIHKQVSKICGLDAPVQHQHTVEMSEAQEHAMMARMRIDMAEAFLNEGLISDAQFEEVKRRTNVRVIESQNLSGTEAEGEEEGSSDEAGELQTAAESESPDRSV